MFPSFLCIGAQKAGTTWLYEQLRQHPDIFLPLIKEMHYFDYARLPFRQTVSFVLRKERNNFVKALRGSVHSASVSSLCQLLTRPIVPFRQETRNRILLATYLFGARTDAWYQRFFGAAGDRIAGDITPAYARLCSDDILAVRERMPNTKILYLLRNPIERSWSQALQESSRRGDKGGARDVARCTSFADFITSSRCTENSDYLGNLARWEAAFPSEQIFVGFLDEIAENPGSFLRAVFGFLGVSGSTDHVSRKAKEKVHIGVSSEMPKVVGDLLAEMYWPSLIELHERFDNQYTKNWLVAAARQLGRPLPDV